MGTDGGAGVSGAELESVDLAPLDRLDAGGLAEHFRRLGMRAKPGQLRAVLGLPPGGTHDEDDERARLAAEFARRRVETVLGLRRVRDLFSAV